MEERGLSIIEYKGLGVQKNASIKASGPIYWFIFHQQGSFYQCSQITIAHFNKNSSSSKCELNSIIQGASRGIES